jgi:hypothetical protein
VSKPDRGLTQLAPPILFFVAAAAWAAIVLLGGGVYLAWAALTSLLSGVLLVAAPSNRATFPLVVASSVFGGVLTLYQLYVGLTLIGSILNTVAIYSTVPFALFTVLYGYILLFARPAGAKEE